MRRTALALEMLLIETLYSLRFLCDELIFLFPSGGLKAT
jgi:hypothetical protein